MNFPKESDVTLDLIISDDITPHDLAELTEAIKRLLTNLSGRDVHPKCIRIEFADYIQGQFFPWELN